MLQPEPITLPDVAPLEAETANIVLRAKSYTVASVDDDEVASAELVRIAGLVRAIKKAFDDPKRKADLAHKAICRLEAQLLAGPAQAESIIKNAIGTWRMAEARRQREEQLRREAEAKRQEEDRRLAEAQHLSDAGRKDEAEALLSEPIMVPTLAAPKPVATPGVGTRTKWKFEIVAPELVKRQFLVPDEAAIRRTVTALGPEAEKLVGGIRVTEDVIVAVRA